jgi:hypothetical protein
MLLHCTSSSLYAQIIEAYAGRKGIQASAFRFMFDGKRIQGEHTPKMVRTDMLRICHGRYEMCVPVPLLNPKGMKIECDTDPFYPCS